MRAWIPALTVVILLPMAIGSLRAESPSSRRSNSSGFHSRRWSLEASWGRSTVDGEAITFLAPYRSYFYDFLALRSGNRQKVELAALRSVFYQRPKAWNSGGDAQAEVALGKHHSILFGFVTGDLYIENAQTGWLPRDREPAAFAGWLVSYLLPSSVVTVPDYTASYVERIHVGRMACGALGTAVHPLNHSAYDPYVQIELQFGRVGEHQLGGLRLSAGLRYYLLEQVYIKAEYFKAGTILSIKNRTGFGFIGAGQNHERHSYQEQGYRFGAGVAFEWGTPEPPAGEPDSYRPTTPEADDRPSDSQNNGDKRDFEPSPPDQEQMPPSDEAIQL